MLCPAAMSTHRPSSVARRKTDPSMRSTPPVPPAIFVDSILNACFHKTSQYAPVDPRLGPGAANYRIGFTVGITRLPPQRGARTDIWTLSERTVPPVLKVDA
ncbi:hypothetical protein C8Q78DRAFT_1042432 [Trametes maxima]|nr:hypothetical protein C8Q78DRAFT_1042432 [Trametes maxima]